MTKLEIKEPLLSENSPYWLIQKIGYGCLLLILVAGFFGLTGNGYFGVKKVTNEKRTLNLDYDPIIRSHADTYVTLSSAPINASVLKLSVTSASFKNTILKKIVPAPNKEDKSDGNLNFYFSVANPSQPVSIQLWYEPQKAGKTVTNMSVNDKEALTYQQIILP